jgi:D-glycero-D-manno-heptose 1,7-bisphosphate phosphatase
LRPVFSIEYLCGPAGKPQRLSSLTVISPPALHSRRLEMKSHKRRKVVYAETDGKVYLVRDGGKLRFPMAGEKLPFKVEKVAAMRLNEADVEMVKPLLDRHPDEWLWRDEAFERDDVDSVVKNAIYMTMMRCVSEVAALDGDRVLMVKAKRGFSAGYWILPGGFMQYGERPEAACAREFEEETGVGVTLESQIGAYVSTFPEKPAYTLGFVYRGRVLSKGFHPKEDEIELVDWQTFDRGLELTRNPFAKWGIVDLYRQLPEKQANVKIHRHGLLKSRGPSGGKGPVVFLDRDGVINKGVPGYLKTWREFEFLPGAIDAMKSLCDGGYRLAIVTNQDVMGWKILSHEGLGKIHDNMLKELAKEGVRIEEIYYCPHNLMSQCRCHKPQPAMLLEAARDLDVTPRQAWMVGDKISDVVVGKHFGCWTVWVADAKRRRRFEADARRARPDFTCDDLAGATKVIRGADISRLVYRASEL